MPLFFFSFPFVNMLFFLITSDLGAVKFGLLIFFKFFGARLIVKINFMRVVLLENYSL